MRRGKVSIGGRQFLTDPTQWSWRTVEVTRRGVDQGAGVGESSLSNEQVWRRTRESWHLGAGQEFGDIPDESSPFRFHESHGIDPWTKRELTLLPLAHSKRTRPPSSQEMLGIGRYLYTCEPTATPGILFTANPNAAAPTWTSVTGANGILSITAGAGYVYGTDGTTVYRTVIGANTASSFSTEDCWSVHYGLGRLIALKDGEIFELSAAGAKIPVFTHPDPSFLWQGACTGAGGIYVWGNSLDSALSTIGKSEVWIVSVDQSTGALAAPRPAAILPPDEQVFSMAYLAGTVGLVTTAGFRFATVSAGDGFLTYGSAIVLDGTQPSAGNPSYVVAGSDGFYVTVHQVTHDTLAEGTSVHSGLIRVRPDRLVESLTPAWAEDITVDAPGNFMWAAAWADGSPFFSAGTEIYGPHPTSHVAAGELSSGWLSWSTPEAKQPDHVRVHVEPQDADTSTTLSLRTEQSPTAAVATATVADGATVASGVASGDNRAERGYLRARLVSENAADSPTVRRLTVGATPVPFISDEVVLPLILADETQDDRGGAPWRGQPFADWQYLMALRDSQERIVVAVGDLERVCRVAEVGVVNGGLGGGNGLRGWAKAGDWPEGAWLVRLVTMES